MGQLMRLRVNLMVRCMIAPLLAMNMRLILDGVLIELRTIMTI